MSGRVAGSSVKREAGGVYLLPAPPPARGLVSSSLCLIILPPGSRAEARGWTLLGEGRWGRFWACEPSWSLGSPAEKTSWSSRGCLQTARNRTASCPRLSLPPPSCLPQEGPQPLQAVASVPAGPRPDLKGRTSLAQKVASLEVRTGSPEAAGPGFRPRPFAFWSPRCPSTRWK